MGPYETPAACGNTVVPALRIASRLKDKKKKKGRGYRLRWSEWYEAVEIQSITREVRVFNPCLTCYSCSLYMRLVHFGRSVLFVHVGALRFRLASSMGVPFLTDA